MNAEETAIWVQMLGIFKGWKEATIYAQSFRINCVTGCVLPYLSAKSLRAELDIEKFGHRLEIIAAIEENELTIMNPVIISIRPNAFFASANKPETPNDSYSRYIRKAGYPDKHSEAANKWFSMTRKPSPWPHGRENSSNKFVEEDCVHDHDSDSIQMSWAKSFSMPKEDAKSKTIPKARINSV
jgi:hypothetical protein